ncbi:hypothetical protein Hanom_Chr00s045156g01776331 [Helianthus anomalus]
MNRPAVKRTNRRLMMLTAGPLVHFFLLSLSLVSLPESHRRSTTEQWWWWWFVSEPERGWGNTGWR